MSTLAIVVSLILLILLAYRGLTVLLLAPLMAALAVILSGDAAFLLPIYTDTFMGALGNFAIQFFPAVFSGCLVWAAHVGFWRRSNDCQRHRQ